MSMRAKSAWDSVRRVLAERSFMESQIERIIPRLHEHQLRQPELLAEIIDCWNDLLGRAFVEEEIKPKLTVPLIPAISSPAKKSNVGKRGVNMATILADVEPDLLLLDPVKLRQRYCDLQGLGIMTTVNENWIALYNAPRGFYLQDWLELTKKILYIDRKVIDLLYDKKEQRAMDMHPILSGAAVTEVEFDHIRTRHLFAERTGYIALSHMRSVQTAYNRPTLRDLILADDNSYLARFSPFCSIEEFSCFSDLIKNHDLDEGDAEMFTQLAELNSIRHHSTSSSPLINRNEAADNKEID